MAQTACTWACVRACPAHLPRILFIMHANHRVLSNAEVLSQGLITERWYACGSGGSACARACESFLGLGC